MSHGASSWLEKAAVLLAGEDRGGRPEPAFQEPTGDAPNGSEEPVSRASALKLGLAAGASLMLGLGRPLEAMAFDREDCIGTCYERVLERAKKDTGFCRRFYNDHLWKTDPRGWARLREILHDGGWATLQKLTGQALGEVCESVVAKRAVNGLDKCDDACTTACGQRFAQATWSRRETCKPPPPPAPYTPPPPPAPNLTSDPCWACVQVGGTCCGPYTAAADGTLVACACANPTLGCERYGCG